MKRAGILLLLFVACRQHEATTSKTGHVTTTNIPSDERSVKEKDLIQPPRARFLESAKLGTKLDATGAVAEEATTFKVGQPIYLTLNLRESPPGLQTHASWQDERGKELARELHPMNGAKTVTFAMTKKLAPGRYKVEGYWGMNLAADKTFEVVKR